MPVERRRAARSVEVPHAFDEAGGTLWRQFHRTDRAIVFHVDLKPEEDRELEALAWLDETERARRRLFLHPRPRRHFTLCRAALREILCGRLGCRNDRLSFTTSEHGKPFALVGGRPAPGAFNVSHSGGQGLVALAPTGRIGVDVEERAARRDLTADIRLLFAPGERAALDSMSGERRLRLFYRLWTMKEALVKAAGAGLSLDTAGFEIPPALYSGADAGTVRLPGAPETAWRLEALDNADFAAALAHEAVSAPGPAAAA